MNSTQISRFMTFLAELGRGYEDCSSGKWRSSEHQFKNLHSSLQVLTPKGPDPYGTVKIRRDQSSAPDAGREISQNTIFPLGPNPISEHLEDSSFSVKWPSLEPQFKNLHSSLQVLTRKGADPYGTFKLRRINLPHLTPESGPAKNTFFPLGPNPIFEHLDAATDSAYCSRE